ncbi:MAG: metallophosphoesterase family protein [Polyangia bacterium]
MKSTAAILLVLGACFALGCDDDVGPPGGDGSAAVFDLSVPPGTKLLARFAVIGDFGVDNADERSVVKLVKSWMPDYIVTVGDNNYPSGEAATIDLNIGQYFSEYIGGYTGKYGTGSPVNRFWPCLGNHDWYSATGAQPYLDYFPSLPGNRRYYDVAVGSVHFFVVDSDPHEPDGIDAASVQADWLRAALAASHECFNIVTFHHPAYSSGDPVYTEQRMRWPFAAWGADAVLTGHQHQYERLVVEGLPYVVDGLGGALNRFQFFATQPGSLVRYNDDFGALSVEVYEGRLAFTFHNTRGDVVDRFDVTRDCATPHVLVDGGP